MSQNINVLFLAAEAEPFVKVGGLGDVAGTLPRALRALSNEDLKHLDKQKNTTPRVYQGVACVLQK